MYRHATDKIASCYSPNQSYRHVEIRRDNTAKARGHRYTASTIRNKVAEGLTRHRTEAAALAWAADMGYTEVVRP